MLPETASAPLAKTTTRALLLAACAAVAACRPPNVRTAPFRARPDSTTAGDLRGPFDGRVVDGAGKPIHGALVYATWSVEEGYGVATPAGFREFVTSTDADGRYLVPRLADVPDGAAVRLSDFYLVIYKRGFVAYRSDRRFADLGPRLDFVQQRHRVELRAWRDEYSHARHLRFVGGGPVLARLTSWEAEDAAAELAGETRARPRIDTDLTVGGGEPDASAAAVASRMLVADDVRAVTGYDGRFETGPLGDEPDTESYSSLHLRAVDRDETFDVAIRVWKLGPAAAQKRYGQLLESLPAAVEKNEIADRSLRATEADIRGVAFLDGKRGAVVLLTCGGGQCGTEEQAVEVARKIYGRLTALWTIGGGQ